MSAVRQFMDLFRDSPTFRRDRANLLTGFTIGIAALLLNGVVLLFLAPILVAADDFVFQSLNETLGFGQIMALILLGGATAFATFLIPLRLATVFFEPRISRYFDQIVLSGVSPVRFMIGKAMSQNLYFGLIVFLLVPYMVLSLTLGAVNVSFFAAGIFLVWLYCLALALATLWMSLYLNELLAAVIVISLAVIMCILGCTPYGAPVCLLSPFPAIVHPLFMLAPDRYEWVPRDFRIVFAASAMALSAFIGVMMLAIYLGPLYGIVRDNSMFGEVVHAGDSKRKRRLRFRFHIQRSSEIAFFYQNRTGWLMRHEGLIRWGAGFGALAGLSLIAYGIVIGIAAEPVIKGLQMPGWWIENFHTSVLFTHGFGLALAAILFSHAKNTTYLRVPVVRGITAEVASLDTWAFLVFLVLSTIGALITPEILERTLLAPNHLTAFPIPDATAAASGRLFDARRFSYEGTAIISVMGLVIYLAHRLLCLGVWMRTVAAFVTGGVYLAVVVSVPIAVSLTVLQSFEVNASIPIVTQAAPWVASCSPVMALVIAQQRVPGHPFPDNLTTTLFYVCHLFLFVGLLLIYRRSARQVRKLYLLVMLCLCLTTSAVAQSQPLVADIDTPGLTVDAVVGWGGMKKRSLPLPVSFLLRNDSGRTLEGVLTLQDTVNRREQRLGDVFLVSGSARRVNSICAMNDWEDCVATLQHQGRIIWRRELDLNPTKLFDADSNLVLFADPEGRNLPNLAESDSSSTVTQSSQFAGREGWPANSVNIKPWQFPLHPGPLFAAHAIVFAERFDERDLNREQWLAVVHWICQGGVVFAPANLKPIVDRLLELSPLLADPALDQGPFQVRRLGLGAIYEFEGPLIAGKNESLTKEIESVVSGLSKYRLNPLVDAAHFETHSNPEANRSRYWIVGLFGMYTLFSGVGALLLFRLNQKQMATYIVAVVGTTSLLAAVIGGYLRLTRGDLQWLTVTQSGAGGLVQVGCLHVQSAGSQGSRVAIRGKDPDLQLSGQSRRMRYYYEPVHAGHIPFSWQPNQDKTDPDSCRIEVPMAPWGGRNCHAVAYRPGSQALAVDFQFSPRQSSPDDPPNSPPQLLAGKVLLKIDNRTAFDFRNCWLVITTTRPNPLGNALQNQRAAVYRGMYQYQAVVDGMTEVYAQIVIPPFAAGTNTQVQTDAKFGMEDNPWGSRNFWPAELSWMHGATTFTNVSRVGVARAWIIGQINTSPSITIDEPNTDFIPHEGVHLFVQELLPEEIPAALNSAAAETEKR